ncbi:MFS transporter [Sphingomonas lacunae]|uniref:MFS transporter n=1 Tax=Sphingomonas lacunae TaxID=2698828 RepID=A0A6M4ASD7_9SPHN|nr:MFS transporter [Sphingomonas lacunae]QJQ31252.1 MFS transporter [Sphingomonas lacunae]
MAEGDQQGMAEREAAFAAEMERNLKRNIIANFLHGMLGMTGFRIVYAPTLIPAWLQMISGSPLIVGLGQSLLQVGLFASPLSSAALIEHRKRIMPMAMRFGSLMRLQVLGLALAGYFLGGWLLVTLTLLMLLLLGVFNGMQRVAFQMLLSKVIPMDRRGRLQAWRNVTGGIIAAILSWVAGEWLIDGNVWGNGYATTFLMAFVLTSLGLVALQWGVREPDSVSVRPQLSLRERMRDVPALIGDINYRWFLIAQAMAMAGRIAAPFYILIAADHMPLDGTTIGLLSLAFLGADTLSNLLWGYSGDRAGYRATFIASMVFTLAGLTLLVLWPTPAATIAAFFAFGIGSSGYQMSAQTMVLEFGSREDLPMRIALSTTVEGGVSAIAPLIGGALLYWAGVGPLVIAASVLNVAALLALLFKVEEPRSHVPPVYED